tara:strand:+ start:421 stop:624 length:204 start_codon:yes stop_codon:yes gene_type:complete
MKEDMKALRDYLVRIWNVILFMFIWIGVPTFIVDYTGDERWYVLLLFTWVFAMVILSYLMDDRQNKE